MVKGLRDGKKYSGTRPGTGDVAEDPLFADPENGDFSVKGETGQTQVEPAQ